MPLPLIPLAAVIGGAVVGVGSQVVINKLQGEKTTKRDVVTGALIGGIPGVSYAKYGSRSIATAAKHLQYYDRSVDTIVGSAMVVVHLNKNNLARIGISAVKNKLIFELTERFIPVPKGSPLSETQSVPGSRNVRERATKFLSPRVGMTYCKRHRKHDMCKRYNIS
jgi:hypothetical protein